MSIARRLSSLVLIALLAVLAACSTQVTEPIALPPASDITTYLWSGRDTSVVFTDSVGVTVGKLDVRDSSGMLLITGITNPRPVTAKLRNDSLLALGFAPGSLLDLDDDCYFGLRDTLRVGHERILSAAMIDGGAGNPLIANDSGLFVFDQTRGRYVFAGLALGDVTHLAYSATLRTIYAASVSTGLWAHELSSALPWSWHQLPTAGLNAGTPAKKAVLAMTADSALFVSLDGVNGLWRYVPSTGTWAPVERFLTNACVTALGLSRDSASISTILAGTADGRIGIVTERGTVLDSGARTHGGTIHAFAATPAAIDVACDSGILHATMPLHATWYPLQLRQSERPVLDIAACTGGLVYVTPTGVYTESSNGATVTALHAPVTAFAVFATKGLIAVGPDGVATIASASGTGGWSLLSGSVRSYVIREEGPVLLLHQGAMQVGASWKAAELVQADTELYPITGRVLERLDSLRVGARSYPDVYVVRYAYEAPAPEVSAHGRAQVAPASWILAYARGGGPILADKLRRDAAGAEHLLSRRMIHP